MAERMGQVVAGALAAVAPVARTSGARGRRPPRSARLARAPGPLEGPICPAQRMAVGVTRVDVAEVGHVREPRHGGVAPEGVPLDRTRRGDAHLLHTFLRCYKL